MSLRVYWIETSLRSSRVAVDELALAQGLQVLVVGLRRAEAVDAGDAGDDQHVAAREQRRGRRVAQPVDLLVDRRVLLDVQVLARDVRLGLVVVVVGDEVLDRVAREVRAELVAELRGERLVVGDHQRRLLHRLDRRGHRHRLAGAGRAEQRHEPLAGLDPLGQRRDRRRLVGGRAEGGVELELGHRRRTFERSGASDGIMGRGRLRRRPLNGVPPTRARPDGFARRAPGGAFAVPAPSVPIPPAIHGQRATGWAGLHTDTLRPAEARFRTPTSHQFDTAAGEMEHGEGL